MSIGTTSITGDVAADIEAIKWALNCVVLLLIFIFCILADGRDKADKRYKGGYQPKRSNIKPNPPGDN